MAVLIISSGILQACQKEEGKTGAPIIVKSNTQYLKFNLASANQLTISKDDKMATRSPLQAVILYHDRGDIKGEARRFRGALF